MIKGRRSLILLLGSSQAGFSYLTAFLEQAKTNGLLEQAIGHAGLTGVRVAPMAP